MKVESRFARKEHVAVDGSDGYEPSSMNMTRRRLQDDGGGPSANSIAIAMTAVRVSLLHDTSRRTF
jgi:hypothetical protein